MTPHIIVFLLLKAHQLYLRTIAKKAEGEIYHPLSNFIDLENSDLKAFCLFEEENERLILRLRSRKPNDEQCVAAATLFYTGKEMTILPTIVTETGWYEKAFYREGHKWEK